MTKAKVVDLSGNPVKVQTTKRDPIISKMLKRASARNTRGEVAAMILITVSPEGVPTQMFHWDSSDGAFTYMLGAMTIAKQSLIQHAIEAAEVEEISVEDE